MRGGEGDCCVVVVGAGAAGALTASHLVTGLSSRYRVALVDPSPTTGRGPAYSTTDDRHLLNVPGERDERLPARPGALLPLGPHPPRPRRPSRRTSCRAGSTATTSPACCRPRPSTPATPASSDAHESVLGIDRRGDRFVVRLSSGQSIVARAVVLATGSRPGTDWAPAALQSLGPARRRPVDPGAARRRPAAGRHRPDHGRPRHLRRPARPHAAHRLAARPASPRCTACPTTPAVPPPPGITRIATLDELRDVVRRARRRTPSRRPATGARPIDGLRPVTAQLWQGLGRRGQAPLPRRPLPHLGRAPPPDAAGHRGPARRRSPTPGGWCATPARWSTPARSTAASR